MPSALRIENLSYKVQNKVIIDNLNFSLDIGQNCLITGASGTGKTTLLSLLAGLSVPNSGDIYYDECSFYSLTPQKRDAFRGENIAIMFQNFHLIKALNVIQNITILKTLSPKKYDPDYIDALLNQLGLWDKKTQKITQLSIGEQQRLAFVRCLAMRPKWLLCDEPTSALDDKNTEIMLELLQTETQKINSSLVIVTHDKRTKNAFPYDHHIEMEK